jgi:hypothetical protein
LIEIKCIFLSEAIDIIAGRIGPLPPTRISYETSASIQGRAQLLGALRHGALLAVGQFGDDLRGVAPEYKPISDGWWASVTSKGNFDDELPFNVTVIDWKTSRIRWTAYSARAYREGARYGVTPPLRRYVQNIRIRLCDIDRLWPLPPVMSTISEPVCTPAARESGDGRTAAIKAALNKGKTPGKNITWKEFCKEVRLDAGVTGKGRGYSDEHIEKQTRAIMRQTGV